MSSGIFGVMPLLRFDPFPITPREQTVPANLCRTIPMSAPASTMEEVVSWKGSAKWHRVLTRAATSTRSGSAPAGPTPSAGAAPMRAGRGRSR